MRDAITKFALILVAAAPLTAACADAPSATKNALGASALVASAPSGFGLATMPVGTTFGLIYAPFRSAASSPAITLKSVVVAGSGVGSVIRVLRVEIVPTLSGKHSIAQSGYLTDPPVDKIAGVCHEAKLLSVMGYRLHPGEEIRLFLIYRTAKQGTWNAPTVTINYMDGGSPVSQALPLGFRGTVKNTASPPTLAPAERACLSHTKLLR